MQPKRLTATVLVLASALGAHSALRKLQACIGPTSSITT